MHKAFPLLVGMAALSLAVACGSAGGKGRNEAVKDRGLNPEMGLSDQPAGNASQRASEQQPRGTSGQSGSVTLSGCLDKNLDTGQFVLVMQDKKQPGHDRLTLQEGPGVKLNGSVGKHVTVAGAMANGKGDAFPRGYGDVKPDGTNDQQRLLVSALQQVGEKCTLVDR